MRLCEYPRKSFKDLPIKQDECFGSETYELTSLNNFKIKFPGGVFFFVIIEHVNVDDDKLISLSK